MTRTGWWPYAILVACLALAASLNSVANAFVYDDVALIQNATRVHSLDGWWREFGRTYWPGGDGYRPLTVIAWRLQWLLGDGSPALFHATNVALHVTGSIAVLWLALSVLPPVAATIAAALYAVHPVHVEAVANVVGQSELAVALLIVLAMAVYLHGRRSDRLTTGRWITIAVLYGLACLIKEHAIVLPLLIVAAELTVVRDPTPVATAVTRLRLPLLALALIASSYLLARSRVVIDGLSGFRPFVVFDVLNLSTTNRILTMIGAAPEWVRLLLWPQRLATQYAPPDIEIAQGLSIALLPGLLILGGIVALMLATRRRSPITSFGIAWVIITLLPSSNFIVPAGFIIAERTLLLPSVGAMIALASAIPWLERAFAGRRVVRTASAAAIVAVVALGAVHSYRRNTIWRDDDRLWRQGVVDSPNSYLAHFRLGLHLLSSGEYREGEAHYRRAIELFPHDPTMAYSFAEQLRTTGRCDAAMPMYRWLFEASPESRRGHIGYAACLLEARRYEEARHEALVWLDRGGRISLAREILVAAKAGRDSATIRRRVNQ
jgi:tetratricopeptide (TPR) repeat protein